MFSNAFGPLNATGTAPGTEFKQVRFSVAPDDVALLTLSDASPGHRMDQVRLPPRNAPWHKLTAFLRSFMGADRFCVKVGIPCAFVRFLARC